MNIVWFYVQLCGLKSDIYYGNNNETNKPNSNL